MNSKLLDYIILALIFAIVINVIMQMFGKCKGKESMSGTPVVSEKESNDKVVSFQPTPLETPSIGAPLSVFDNAGPASTQKSGAEIVPAAILPIIDSAPVNDARVVSASAATAAAASEVVNKVIQLRQETQNQQKTCPLMGTVFENDRYIKEFVLGGKYDCNNNAEEKNFTRAEILNYHNSMFDFNEQINNSSSGVDVVDKINQLYTSGNNELAGCGNKKISDVFDGLTQSMIDKKKKCANPGCLIPPIMDQQTKMVGYVADSGMGKFIKHGLMFEDDNVNNGGKFYDDVEGSDSEFEDNLVY